MSNSSSRQRKPVLALLSAALSIVGTDTLHAQTSPSDNPKGPGLQPSLPPTGGGLTPTPFEPAEHVFNRFDTNRTGFLTRDQLGLLERFPFDEADINADGRLSIAEFAKVWGAYNSKK
jgi:hypothetical protein